MFFSRQCECDEKDVKAEDLKGSHKKTEIQEECDWSLKEKKMMLCGMKRYGLHDMKGISSMIETKYESQVTYFLTRALKRNQFLARRLNRKAYSFSKRKLYKVLLLRWRKDNREQLTKNESMVVKIDDMRSSLLSNIKTDKSKNNPSSLARALLTISMLEEHPSPTRNGVDFRAAYKFLSKIVSGKYIDKSTWPDPTTSRFIRNSFQQLVKIENTKRLTVIASWPGGHETFNYIASSTGTSETDMPSTSSC